MSSGLLGRMDPQVRRLLASKGFDMGGDEPAGQTPRPEKKEEGDGSEAADLSGGGGRPSNGAPSPYGP